MTDATRPWSWMTFVLAVSLRVAAALVAALGGAALGFLMGANFGGNYATDFQLGGARGYEATAPIGALLGAVPMALVGYMGASRLTARWTATT